MRVLFLLRNMQIYGYWYSVAYQYSKLIDFVKNFKEVKVIKGSVLILSYKSNNLLTYGISRNHSMNVQNWSSVGVLKKRCNLRQKLCILFEVLTQLPSTTTETELSFYYYRWSVRLTSKRKCPADQISEITLESLRNHL